MIRKTEIKLSLSVNRVVEVQEDNIDITDGSPSLVSLLVGRLRAKISRLFRAKFRDVLCRVALW